MMNMMNIHKSQLCLRVLIHSLPSKIAIWRSPRNRVAQRETPLEKNLREVVGRCTAWGWQKKGGFVGKSWEIFHLPRDLAGTSSSKIDIKYSTYSGIRDPTGSFSASDLSWHLGCAQQPGHLEPELGCAQQPVRNTVGFLYSNGNESNCQMAVSCVWLMMGY